MSFLYDPRRSESTYVNESRKTGPSSERDPHRAEILFTLRREQKEKNKRMAAGPEAIIQRAFQAEIKRLGGYCVKQHGNCYSVAGTPDIIGCLNGRFFGIEFKAGKGVPSPKQIHELGRISHAGGISGVAYSVAEAIGLITAAPEATA